MQAYHRAKRRWLTMFAALAVASSCASCGSRSSTTKSDTPANELCRDRLPAIEPQLPEAATEDAPSSQLTVAFDVTTTRLQRELESYVPVLLAKEQNRSIGVAGLANYEVRRGAFTFSTERSAVVVTTPIRVAIDVCKPFGPICIGYGQCSPRLLSSARVPVTLGADYELEPTRVSVQVTESCRILGTDVTANIRDLAEVERKRVEREIAARTPRVGGSVRTIWQILKVPIAIGSALCVRIEPERVEQSLPKLAGGVLDTSVSVIAKLRVEEPCIENRGFERVLPVPQVSERVGDGIALNVPIHMAWNEVDASLTRSLATVRLGKGGEDLPPITRIVRVRTRGTVRDQRAALALAATVEGSTCGEIWFTAAPWYDLQTSRVRLRDVMLAQKPPLLAADTIHELELTIARHARVSLPIDPSSTAAALRALVLRLESQLPAGVTLSLEFDTAQVHPIAADERALIPVVSLRGTARLTLR